MLPDQQCQTNAAEGDRILNSKVGGQLESPPESAETAKEAKCANQDTSGY